jgi:hypothetical protein
MKRFAILNQNALAESSPPCHAWDRMRISAEAPVLTALQTQRTPLGSWARRTLGVIGSSVARSQRSLPHGCWYTLANSEPRPEREREESMKRRGSERKRGNKEYHRDASCHCLKDWQVHAHWIGVQHSDGVRSQDMERVVIDRREKAQATDGIPDMRNQPSSELCASSGGAGWM